MAIIGNLPKALGEGTRKLAVNQTAITGTGAVTTGLTSILAGGVVATVNNSGSVLPASVASVYLIAGGVVSVVVTQLNSTTNAVSGSALNVNTIAIGQ